MSSSTVRIGKIVGCHGLRGELKVRPASDEADWAETAESLILKHPKTGQEIRATVDSTRYQGPLVLVRFQEYPDRTAAEPLIGSTLYADMDALPPPDEDEYWADDLIGLTVVDHQTGRTRGTVKDLLSSAGSDFLEIQIEGSSETVVVPFINHFFPHVDLEKGTVTVDLLGDFLGEPNLPVTAERLEQ